jgi:hypothetical protein
MAMVLGGRKGPAGQGVGSASEATRRWCRPLSRTVHRRRTQRGAGSQSWEDVRQC